MKGDKRGWVRQMTIGIERVKLYRYEGCIGVQIWFTDGASVRLDGFESASVAIGYVEQVWGELDVAVN